MPLAFTLLLGPVPAPPQVVDAVEEIEVESSINEASAFRLRLGVQQTAIGDWSVLELDLFRPLLPLTIRVGSGLGLPEALINGYVSGQQVTYGEEPGTSVLEVTGLDVTLLMNMQEKVMPWPNLPDSAIAAALFGQYAVVPRATPTTPTLTEPEGTTTQRGTDIRFLKGLARRQGFECYVQPESLSGIDQGFFQRRPSPLGLPQAVLNVSQGPQTNVTGFTVRYEMTRPTSAIAAGLDVATKALAPALGLVSTDLPAAGLEPALSRVLPPGIVRPAGMGLATAAELQPAVQAIVNQSSWALVAEGTVGGEQGILRPGGYLNVRGAGRSFSGSYYVTRVAHSIRRDGSHTQHFTAERNAVGLTGAEVFVDL